MGFESGHEDSFEHVSEAFEMAPHQASQTGSYGSSDALTDEDLQDDYLRFIHPKFKWYIVNTYSGSEEAVKLNLKDRISKAHLTESFGEVYVPKTAVEKALKSGKKKMISKTSFPGYVIVQMDLNDNTMNCVVNTPKVTGFVGNRKKPRPMPDTDVLKLMSPNAKGVKKEAKVGLIFSKGETLKVIDGPFTNFHGIIEEVKPDKMKIKLLVSIFGRETPVELSYSQVSKIS